MSGPMRKGRPPGKSGTGPKVGGPHCLPRFATEQTVTVNTAAAAGNASLLTLGE